MPIGLPLDSAQSVGAQTFTLNDKEAAQCLKNRPRDGHKGTFGKVAIIAGSTGLTGAACMASISALCSGAGLVTLGIPASLNPILEEKLTEVMTVPLEDKGQGHLIPESLEDVAELLKDKDVLAFGPGCGKSSGVFEILRHIFGQIHISIVIDADGLNHISKDMNLLKDHRAAVILTPHPGEMSRLTGIALQDILKRPVETAVDTARKYNVIVLLKGAATVVADPSGKTYINTSGNSGMGKGGSGDVLTGMIASLVAQGYSPFDAAVYGCYIHGRAGDEAAAQLGEVGMIAGDIIDAIPRTFKKLYELRTTIYKEDFSHHCRIY
jgi:NAD(P)H-hydrate epimerase